VVHFDAPAAGTLCPPGDTAGREKLKTVNALEQVHIAQLLTYLKLTGCQVGLLINFNVVRLLDGVRRVINGYPLALSVSSGSSPRAL
jgi:hypothetical protein